MKGFFGSSGNYFTGPQRMAMFSKISQRKLKYLIKEDPKELRVSDRIAAVLEPIPVDVEYDRGEFNVLTGSPYRGGVVHLHLTRDLDGALPLEDEGIGYVIRK